ncbi:MAG: ABC transporter permease [Candidatus Pelagibacterales bacterium]|jgi:octopine/nopaline transport system permease protein|tara:strand:- start:318 stop:1001 length:684 start_codon:yes stop_codon:yes gene_type:complete
MRLELMYESFFKIVEGIPLTLQVVSISTILGIFLAVAVALMRISGNRLMSLPAYYFVYLIRGTPLLLQLYFVYYGLSQFEAIRESILWPILKEPYWCGIITLTISTGAYSSEIIRGGILSVSKNYIEASGALGLSQIKTFMLITLPITVRQALPAYGNELILMVKASSLISIVTLMEITGIARTIISKTYAPVEIFLVAGSIYLVINFIIVMFVNLAERRLGIEKAT